MISGPFAALSFSFNINLIIFLQCSQLESKSNSHDIRDTEGFSKPLCTWYSAHLAALMYGFSYYISEKNTCIEYCSLITLRLDICYCLKKCHFTAAQNLCKEQNKEKQSKTVFMSTYNVQWILGKGEQNQWNPNAANEFAYKDVRNSCSCSYHIFADITSHLVHQTVD